MTLAAMSDGSQARAWAYGLTVAGGALTLGGAAMMALMGMLLQGTGWADSWWMPGHRFMFQTGFPFLWFAVWGLLVGVIVLWAGVRMRPGGPGEGTTEGVMAIVGGILGFPAMAGFMVAPFLSVAGGALSLVSAARRDQSDGGPSEDEPGSRG